MKIYNGTAHEINIFSPDDVIPAMGGRRLVLREGAKPIKTIPYMGELNCQKDNSEPPISETWITGAIRFVSHDAIPPSADLVIVSNMFRSAVIELGGDTSRLGVICDAVYESADSKRPVGCLKIAVG